MAIWVQEPQVGQDVLAPMDAIHDMMNMPPGFWGDQSIAFQTEPILALP